VNALVLPPVLDACCGGRMFWFDHGDKRALFCDRRRAFREVDIGTPGTKGRKPLVVEPDMIADFTAMPFPSESFALVVFDPPHLEKLGATGKYATSYGRLEGDWQGMIRAGFAECFRVLRHDGVLVFKWCEYEIPLSRVLALTPEKPLFGHISGKRQQTHWVCFLKQNKGLDPRMPDSIPKTKGATHAPTR
jgi:SAM-dependent methyltransferase